MSTVDYRRLYEDYWSRPDRWGSDSFVDVDELAERILRTCGGGRLLDVGCGMGRLVRRLLRCGVDAMGVDVAPRVVEAGNRTAPGRFACASILDLPFEAGSFETVVCCDLLEHLTETDVPRALGELYRVTRRNVFVTVSTQPDRDRMWHLTVHDRGWWENALFEAGFRKHLLTPAVLPFEALENEPPSVTIVLEKIPASACQRWPLRSLRPTRDLHMDMLRETGRRSDAHLARYWLAVQYIRARDVVLDLGCGLGYGTAMLAAASPAERVLGVDADAAALEYATTIYGQAAPGVEFRLCPAEALSELPSASFDMVVAFEILEHLRDPQAVLSEIDRLLRPAGRIVVSVPNRWVDATGRDPNPHHLHVYDGDTLRAQLERHFGLEAAFAQIAGGGLTLTDRPRRLRPVSCDGPLAEEAEWWLAVGMKSPLASPAVRYEERLYREHAATDVVAFQRDYDNPWIARGLVAIGLRATRPRLLEQWAEEVLATARAGSADAGGALCVLAYRLLEQENPPAERVEALLDRIWQYDRQADDTPHAWRWRVSNAYVAGLLLLALGRRHEAREAFLKCAALDVLRVTPLLATKTVDALYMAGLLAALDGQMDAARQCWVRALREVQRVLHSDWTNIWGTPEKPLSFGLPEVRQLADLAVRCVRALDEPEDWCGRPGRTWAGAHDNQAATLARLEKELRRAVSFFEESRTTWQAEISRRDVQIEELRRWNVQLEQGKAWLEEQRSAWEETARRAEERVGALEAVVAELERAKAWLEEQRSNWEQTARASEQTIRELRAWTAELEKAKVWLSEQVEQHQAALRTQGAQLDTLRRRVERCRRRWAYRVLARLGLMERLDGD
jgi:2-polyprenyl-3-methyl-5-hydroxy-6-metoxy-1,4-benzoquinol methylase